MSRKNGAVNEALRASTRGLVFVLSLGKTQVATLVYADLHYNQETMGFVHRHPLLRNDIGAMRRLNDLGLLRDGWTLTHEGGLVLELLKSTGIYAELEKEFRRIAIKLERSA